MKKTLLTIFCFTLCFNQTKAFLGEDLGLNLYKNIDQGLETLETIQYEYELSGQGKGIVEHINSILKEEGLGECIEGELNSNTISQISQGNINTLSESISPKCKGENDQINTAKLSQIISLISSINTKAKEKAEEKSKQIYKISRIGIYSDGLTENSPFDLIKDIEDIDTIIFASKYNYEGEEYTQDDALIEMITGKENQSLPTLPKLDDIIGNTGDSLPETTLPEYTNKDNEQDEETGPNNNYICADDTNNSGLSENTLKNILNDIENKSTNTPDSTGENLPPSSSQENSSNNNEEKKKNDTLLGKYSPINSPWPCYDFFCITVEFITYQHKLLGGGENITIEYLLNRSNKHLRKFVSTSLIPAKMTTNNFEIGLKDLSLPDIFHMGFVITEKPVPILSNVESKNISNSEAKEKGKKFTKANLLEEYYKNLGLEYQRQNDIKIFKNKEPEIKTVIDTGELVAGNVKNKSDEYFQNLENKKKQNTLTSETIQKGLTSNHLQDFEQQFTELEGFNKYIQNYSQSLKTIIQQMQEIPIDKG